MDSRRFGTCFGAAAAIALWSAAAVSEPFRYEGVCEASAAAVLDESHFAVASDETETLTIYERGKPTPVATFLHPEVTDLEGSARIGDTVFWLTSHSLNKEGEDKKKRKVLFATVVGDGSALSDGGTNFRDLREKVASLLRIEEEALKPTLNIEGLAATTNGDLLVGLRAPLTDDQRARVVKIENPFALVGLPAPAGAGPASAAPAVWALDLGGRGIRSIERVGTGEHAFLIVAGSVEDQGAGPALYWWDGLGDTVSPGPSIPSLGGPVPEAMISWNANDIQIIGDNGDNCRDEEAAPRWFPSVDVRP